MTSKAVFVQEPSSHLLCPVCNNLFLEPVISVQCGHTFCKSCLLTNEEGKATLAECPVDKKSLRGTLTVPNRSIDSQINELQIFCKCGIRRLNSRNEFVEDEGGCPEIIPLGSLDLHDETCSYVKVDCPNSALCGKFQRKSLDGHLAECAHYSCPYQDRGCSFRGTKQKIEEHRISCNCQLSTDRIPAAVLELQQENIELKTQVEALNHKLTILEQSHDNLLAHMKKLEIQMQAVNEKLTCSSPPGPDGLATRSASVRSYRRSRTNSTGSLSGLRNSMEFTYSFHRAEDWEIPFEFKCIGTLMGHNDVIKCIAIHGHKVYSSGADYHIKVWDIEKLSKGCIQVMQGHTNTVQALVASSDYLYSAGDDRTIRMWKFDSAGTEFKCRNDAHTKSICALLKVGDYLFSSSHSSIKIWSADKLENVHTINGLHHWVRALAVDHKKERLYSGSHNSLSVWDTQPPFALKRKLDHTYGSIYSIAITSQYLLLGTSNQNVQVRAVDSFAPQQPLTGHIGIVNNIGTSPSGQFAVTCCYDGKTRIFNLENFLSLQALSRHQGSVNAIALRNGLLFTGSEDKDIKIFKYFKSFTYSSYGIHITPGKDT